MDSPEIIVIRTDDHTAATALRRYAAYDVPVEKGSNLQHFTLFGDSRWQVENPEDYKTISEIMDRFMRRAKDIAALPDEEKPLPTRVPRVK